MTAKLSRDTVLVIDDDPYLRELVSAIGRTCGVHVLEASDCTAALHLLEQNGRKIKMILLDYYLPGMQPAQCASAIVEKAGASIPVVLLTAAVDAASRAAELKISRWISKPFEVSTLTGVMTENIQSKKSRT
jgi:CheY-like chemotaxis protein